MEIILKENNAGGIMFAVLEGKKIYIKLFDEMKTEILSAIGELISGKADIDDLQDNDLNEFDIEADNVYKYIDFYDEKGGNYLLEWNSGYNDGNIKVISPRLFVLL